MPCRWPGQRSRRAKTKQIKAGGALLTVLVTTPNLATARKLARAALRARLVACANLVPKIESQYWGEGKIETGPELLLLLKTSRARLAALEKLVLSLHPYDTPEFVVLPIRAVNHRYGRWWEQALQR